MSGTLCSTYGPSAKVQAGIAASVNTVRLGNNADGLLGREVRLGTTLGGALDRELRHLALDCTGIGTETAGRKDLLEDLTDDGLMETLEVIEGKKEPGPRPGDVPRAGR